MSAVEKVARAISSERDSPNNPFPITEYDMDLARAAITALLDDMAEPSEGMVKTFIDAALATSLGPDCKWPDYARRQWQAMLAQYRKEMGD